MAFVARPEGADVNIGGPSSNVTIANVTAA
jgi:hypothetical protein